MRHGRFLKDILSNSQAVSHRGLVTSATFAKALTEGTPTREAAWSGFSKLRQNMTNIISGNSNEGELKGEDKVDRTNSPEAHPFPDQRRESFYAHAQWQDGGVIHDVKPNGQGISLSTVEHATLQGEKDLTSA
ncbi:hypothetical protein ABBQ32_011396 [Trebouxia sp. C0010 RCD-2024]